MTNTITVDQLKELLQIQKEFDDRIPTLNLEDSKVAYIVEFFEWFNTLETFKNWKKKPGKPLSEQLDELSDMLAFSLSIVNQVEKNTDEIIMKSNDVNGYVVGFHVEEFLGYLDGISFYDEEICATLSIAKVYYSIDQLIEAYKKKMQRNHDRQDGTADKDKGYV